jgi:ABC-type Mn2+/Zn2+ transport system ATPase subunit
MSAPLLTLHDAEFGYGRAPVLQGVRVAVGAGEFVAVIGPNGGGKSTLLRGLLGSLPPRAGRREAAPGLRLAYVPQELGVDRDLPLTAHDLVWMGTWSRAGAAMSVSEALARVDLAGARQRRFADLSGGQRQRVLLARALIGGPQLLLLDEPVSGVDHAAQETIYTVLSAAVRQGAAVVIVTHQLSVLAGRAQRVLEAAEGRVAARALGGGQTA